MALIPFKLPPNTAAAADTSGKGPGMLINVHVGFEPTAATAAKPAANAPSSRPFTGPSPLVASTQPTAGTQESGPPAVQVEIFDANRNSLFVQEINGGKPAVLDNPNGTDRQFELGASQVASLAKQPVFYVTLIPVTPNVKLWVEPDAAQLIVPVTDKPEPVVVGPAVATDEDKPVFTFVGRQGTAGQQIRGDEGDKGSVAVYQFANVDVRPAGGGSTVPVELRVGIERGGDEPSDADAPTHVNLSILNHKSGQLIDAGEIKPENNRTAYATVPASAFDGGNFDVVLRCKTPEHWVSITPASLSVVRSETFFGVNLFKSLFIIWLLAVLVISISIFASTFLSWPIAVVLTLVILLGRWGVEQLGDAASAGLGRQFVQDFGVRDPASAQALSNTVEKLNSMLTVVATVLPDISRFSATEDIERGISIPPDKIVASLGVLIGFGVPLSVLAYVFLKNKEVAP
jgi:hypothetical protein